MSVVEPRDPDRLFECWTIENGQPADSVGFAYSRVEAVTIAFSIAQVRQDNATTSTYAVGVYDDLGALVAYIGAPQHEEEA